jgi:hypothetical protein
LVIVPTNNTLMATDPAQANPKTRQLIRKWASLHAVRTALGLAATSSHRAAPLWSGSTARLPPQGRHAFNCNTKRK